MSFSVIVETLEHVTLALPGILAVAVAMLLGKVIFDRTHGFDPREEVEDSPNIAFGLVYASYFVALALALVGALFGRGEYPVWLGAAKILGEGCVVIVLVRVSLWVNDRFVLARFSVEKEIGEDRNLAVGFCVAGALLATGFAVNGALTGVSQNLWTAMRDLCLYWLFGQMVLVVGALLFRRMTPLDVHRIIELDDNTAVGLAYGGYLVGLGIVTRTALVGAGLEPLSDEVLRTLTIAVVGIAALIAIRVVADLFFLRKSTMKDEIYYGDNLVAGLLAASSYIAVSILLAGSLHR